MIKSIFINDIVTLLLDGDKPGIETRRQKNYIAEAKFDYTGVGVFVSFTHEKGIEKFKSTNDGLILNGVTIKSPELKVGAEATLFFKNGLIDHLEIWSYDGKYPERELDEYELKQEWKGAPGLEIKSTRK